MSFISIRVIISTYNTRTVLLDTIINSDTVYILVLLPVISMRCNASNNVAMRLGYDL